MGRKLGLIKKTAIMAVGIIFLSFLAAVASDTQIAGGPAPAVEAGGEVTAEDISSKLIRLHVIANSDSPEDQALKLEVRDKIIEALNSEFENVDDIESSRQIIRSKLKDIEEIARQEVLKSGKNYSVKALYGRFPFPVKSYGYVTLPAGEYEALRVILGEGEGANWWCVLFPPLCFVDITHGISREEAMDSLGKVLTREEMDAIQAMAEPNKPVEVRFKIVEWWQNAKGKLDDTIKMTFK